MLTGGRDLLAEVQTIKGIKVLAVSLDVDDVKVLRDTGDQLRERLGSGVLVLAVVGGPEVKLLAMVSKDLVDKIHAGTLLGEIATQLGGKAGGRPDLALGGGRNAAGVPEALAYACKWIEDRA